MKGSLESMSFARPASLRLARARFVILSEQQLIDREDDGFCIGIGQALVALTWKQEWFQTLHSTSDSMPCCVCNAAVGAGSEFEGARPCGRDDGGGGQLIEALRACARRARRRSAS